MRDRMDPKLSDVIAMARGAGEILRAGYGQEIQVDHKGVIDPVTDIDRQSEAYIIDAIRRRFPSHRIVTEESGELHGEDSQVWYIDPLDGTVNFAHGVPLFAVSLAYVEGDEVVLGAVYTPLQDECYYAQRGQGAWLDGRSLRVSLVEELSQSLLVTGFPYNVWNTPLNNLDQFTRFTLRSQGVRRLGSAALDLCYVAAGRLDGYWEVQIEPWDIAAGALIVQEAGGMVTKKDGDSDYLSPPFSVLAANPRLHAAMLEVLSG